MPDDAQVLLDVLVQGKELPLTTYVDLLSVEVHDDIEAPSMATIRLSTWDTDKLAFSWVDDDLFAPGKELTIKLGYQGSQTTSVFMGDITGLDLELGGGATPVLTVRAYDRRHRMLRGTRTRSFVKMTDSDIASQIARENGLSAKTVDSKIKHDYVLQHAQLDLDFLQQRAAAIGFEVFVVEKYLYFRPRGHKAEAAVALVVDKDILDFNPRLSTQSQAGEIDVLGWNPAEKKAILGKAAASTVTAMGDTTGLQAADKAFGKEIVAVVERPVLTQAEAEQLAAGQLTNLALGYIVGDGSCYGRAEVRAGSTLDISGAGKRFSGSYYVTQADHTFSPEKGYRTRFTVRRNAT